MQHKIIIDEPYLCSRAEWDALDVPYFSVKHGDTDLLIIDVGPRDGMGEDRHTRLSIPADILRGELTKALDSAEAQGLRFGDDPQ